MSVCRMKLGSPLTLSLLMGVLLLCAGTVGQAHHSFAMFDDAKQTVVEGVVKEFRFVNPHVYINLEVASKGGQSQAYLLEAPSPVILKRLGWTRSTLKAGDKIKVDLHPLKDGKPGGNALRVTFADGKVMSLENEDVKYGKK